MTNEAIKQWRDTRDGRMEGAAEGREGGMEKKKEGKVKMTNKLNPSIHRRDKERERNKAQD